MSQEFETRQKFWSEHFTWPNDTLTHVFLARAVLQLGRVFHGDAWTGEEPSTVYIEELPSSMWVGMPPESLEMGAGILASHHEGYRSRNPGILASRMPTDEEWPFAVEWSRQESRRSIEALYRYIDVWNCLAVAFRNERVATALVPFAGGEEVNQPRTFWNCSYPGTRFDFCRVDPVNPFGPLLNRFGHWIYVERQTFNAFLTEFQGGQAVAALETGAYISPYVQCMIDTSCALGVAPDNQPKKEEVIAMLPKHWRSAATLSEKDMKSMATFVRDPESKLGRANPALKARKAVRRISSEKG